MVDSCVQVLGKWGGGAHQGPLDSCLAVLGGAQQAASSSVETEKVRKTLALFPESVFGCLAHGLSPPAFSPSICGQCCCPWLVH